MKNYPALVDKLQSRKQIKTCICFKIILQCQHYVAKLVVTGIISIIMEMAKQTYKSDFILLYLCDEALFQEIH